MTISRELMHEARLRYEARTPQRTHRAEHRRRIGHGGDLLEVDEPSRLARHLMYRGETEEALELLRLATEPTSKAEPHTAELHTLERIIAGNELMSVDFLFRGQAVARAIGRVVIRTPSGADGGYGTGFLVSPRVMMTNNHVLGYATQSVHSLLQFDYYESTGGHILPAIEFALDPGRFFLTDVGLDFTLVAVAERNSAGQTLMDRSWIPLHGPSGKAVVGSHINIIQHPGGAPQQISLRDNRVVDVFDRFLHYTSDTRQGSSGAPAFNDGWDLAALHHSGVPEKDSLGRILLRDGSVWDRSSATMSQISWRANEGIRVSRIVTELRTRQANLSGSARALLDEVLAADKPPLPFPHPHGETRAPAAMPAATASPLHVAADGTAHWTLPLQVSVALGGLTLPAPAAAPAPLMAAPLVPESPTVVADSTPPPPAPGEAPLSHPIFEGLTLELTAASRGRPQSRARTALRRALVEALGDGASARLWTIEEIASADNMLDLLPPTGYEIAVHTAWDLTHALRAQRSVVSAEPCFELTHDNLPDVDQLGEASEWFRRAEVWETLCEHELLASMAVTEAADAEAPDWSPRLIRAIEAWQVPPAAGGKSRGEGILVAHPDSGYRTHDELDDERVRRDLQKDFIDDDDDAEDADASHGLATASVLMSGDHRVARPRSVTGVAPAAQIVPLRVARRRKVPPTPVLFRGGMIRLRKAIEYALDIDCQVVSISLGGLANKALHAAVKQAMQQNVIVCAAAGNYVRFVVWPAAYPEVVAVAGCNAARQPWSGSSRGPKIDVTAPAKDVWKAQIGADGAEGINQSKGTSYAVASTAGVAALWLAHHGREALIERYQKHGFHLTTVFRHILRSSSEPLAAGSADKFGAGIVHAERALQTPLPSIEALRQSDAVSFEAAMAAPTASEGLDMLLDAADSLPAEVVYQRLWAMLGGTDDEPQSLTAETLPGAVEERLAGVGDELAFHILTRPRLRETLLYLGQEPGQRYGLEEGLMILEADPRVRHEVLASGLSGLAGLSRRLRRKIEPISASSPS